jgi:hypothetical protein
MGENPMTEAEWLADCYTLPMYLTFLQDDGITQGAWGRRKLRLFACACCRRVWDLLPGGVCQQAVVVSERDADGRAGPGELAAIRRRCHVATSGPTPATCAAEAARAAAHRQAWQAAQDAALAASSAAGMLRGVVADYQRGFQAERQAQMGLLRDIIGNPYRPPAVVLSWVTQRVVDLAQRLYEKRAFGDLPILADALEEAGCSEPAILSHCRSGSEHVRGCWALDLILGKS